MAANIGAIPIAAEKHFTAKQRIPFALEVEIIGQRHRLVTMLKKPFLKELLLALPLGKTKFAGNEFLPAYKACIGGENHIRQLRLRRNQLDLAAAGLEGLP